MLHRALRPLSLRRWLALALAPLSACAAPPTAPAPGQPALDDGRTPVTAVQSDVERVLALSLKDNRVQEHLRFLTQNIGPRLTGSNHFNQAAEWCLQQLRSWGLDAQLEKWGEFNAGFDRGPSHGAIVAPARQELVFITPAWTPGTKGPVRGQAVLEPKDLEGVEALKGKLSQAWIVRRKERPDGKTRKALDEACEGEGAAGFVSRSFAGDRLIMSGDQRVKLDKLPKHVRIQLRADQYDELQGRLEKDEALELEFDVDNRFTPGPVPCFNVVADLKGSEFPDEYVIVGGHLDSWDGAQGAQDNGTGVATTLEAARLIAHSGVKPRRTVRFLLFGGEEQGLFGSEFYVKEHKDLLEKTSIALIHDGGGSVLRGITPNYRMLPDFQHVFAPLAGADPRFPFEVREVEGLQNSGDSDHAPFIQAGVPGFFWEQSEEGYDHVHHTQYDTFETVDPDQQKQSARVVALAALGFANLDHLIDRADMEPIPRRRMGVQLEGTKITSISSGGQAQKAGLQEGDVIVSIDGVKLETQNDVTRELQTRGPKKTFSVSRDGATLEVILDYSAAPGENERLERAKRKAEWQASQPPARKV